MSVTDLTPTPDSCATLRAAHEFSSWCSSPGKRALDWVCALSLLLAALPLMVIVAALIKFTSQGPAFFRQTRVGRDGALFQLMKFRTMYDGGRGPRLALTRRGDPRVTRVGRVLRKWKLDELPQLLNVVRGERNPHADGAALVLAQPIGEQRLRIGVRRRRLPVQGQAVPFALPRYLPFDPVDTFLELLTRPRQKRHHQQNWPAAEEQQNSQAAE